jgi:hypothetical protein
MTLGALVGAGLAIAALAGRGSLEPVFGQYGAAGQLPTVGSELIAHVTAADGQPLTITVVDPVERWIGIYQVNSASGEISLKSARNITWDLKLPEYNSGKPLPQEIRNGLPR